MMKSLKGVKNTVRLDITDMDSLLGSGFVERSKHEKNKPVEVIVEISSPVALNYSLVLENGMVMKKERFGVSIDWETFREILKKRRK